MYIISMQSFLLLFVVTCLPLYNCYLKPMYYSEKNNLITLKSSNNNNFSSNKKLFDDYSKFLNNNKKNVTLIDLDNINKFEKKNIKKTLNNNNNIVIIYNSNTNTIIRNMKDILKY